MEGWGVKDESIWATEDEYTNWNKKSRTNSKAIGRMFYKTKLCCKFRSGTCPYVTNCNFAHRLDELRKPPENWQEIVAAHEADTDDDHQYHQQHQIPIISTSESRGESQRSYKGRHCKKFYTQEGCPYGDSCTFLHDEQSRARESVAISVTPALAPHTSVAAAGTASTAALSSSSSSLKPSNWKTRICNKWETTGSCPFGAKCHFAHGWPGILFSFQMNEC
ncbi:hypothetical protein RND81_11G079200 [Saponaria officinalis]|uniref:C3H1-type domain-containing protein n=1 Tax=Saponaria officinalis TaxID=3572 RepID=A0AAW1HKW2_SAPOF